MSLSVFLSYSRADEALAVSIAQDLTEAGVEVWRDERLSGGQSWWDAILAAIRAADVLVLVLSARSLDSEPCTRERTYAQALGKSLLPVRVDDTSPRVAPPSLASQEWIDYVPDDRASVVRLLRAVYTLPPAPPLPAPLPDPPAVPLSYVNDLSALVHRSEDLSAAEQHSVLFQLREGLRDPEERTQCVQLLERLRLRRDLLASVSREIDEVLPASRQRPEQVDVGPPPPPVPPPPVPPPPVPPVPVPPRAEDARGPTPVWQPPPSRPRGPVGPGGHRRWVPWLVGAGAVGVLAVVTVVLMAVLGRPPDRYGDDAELDALWDQCYGGDFGACDELYLESEIGSLYELMGETCGDRTDGYPDGGCVTLPFPYSWGDDVQLDALLDQCEAGDMPACDSLYAQSPAGSGYELVGSLCGGASPEERQGRCAAE